MNTYLRKEKQKNVFEKYFSMLINNAVFGITIENWRKHRDMKLVTNQKKKKKNYLVSEPNYHRTIFFSDHLLAIETR